MKFPGDTPEDILRRELMMSHWLICLSYDVGMKRFSDPILVNKLVEELPEEDRNIILWRYRDKLPYITIAKKLDGENYLRGAGEHACMDRMRRRINKILRNLHFRYVKVVSNPANEQKTKDEDSQ